MPRDYKHRAQRKKKRTRLSPWVGVISGLAIGLFVAFLVFIKMQAQQPPPAVFDTSILPPVENTTPPASTEKRMTPPPPKPRFDFYTLLPEMEVMVPDDEIALPAVSPAPALTQAAPPARETKTDNRPAAVTPRETYLLQVGSFRNGEQAERFKAELALLGLETSIQKVTIDNKDTYHRVRVGPFHDSGALNHARSLLKKQDIDSRTIKLKN
jgi:cell division protein FtsN